MTLITELLRRAKEFSKKSKLLSRPVEYFLEEKNKKLTDKIANKLIQRGCTFSSLEQLVQSEVKDREVCHVIGSGWSLNESIDTIDSKNAYIIGCNNAAFSKLTFDLYFTEHAGKSCRDIMEMQLSLFEETIFKEKTPLYFKNIYEEKNDIEFMVSNFADKAKFLKDYQIQCTHENNLKAACKRLLAFDKVYLKQYSSTVISMIVIAYHMGFKNIKIHGVDFGGPYFYETDDFTNTRSTPLPTNIYQHFKQVDNKKIHNTSVSELGLPVLLKELAGLLKKEGVNLNAAESSSPLVELLN